MTLYQKIIAALPELSDNFKEFGPFGSIELRDDSDGAGAYIDKWDYVKPIPDGLKLGK